MAGCQNDFAWNRQIGHNPCARLRMIACALLRRVSAMQKQAAMVHRQGLCQDEQRKLRYKKPVGRSRWRYIDSLFQKQMRYPVHMMLLLIRLTASI